jgi:hypothetical protein
MGFLYRNSVLLWGFFFLWVGYEYERSVLGGVAMIWGIASIIRDESYFKGINVTSIFPVHYIYNCNYCIQYPWFPCCDVENDIENDDRQMWAWEGLQ